MGSGEHTNESLAGGGHLNRFRIFLASPGDVPLECKLAREAITNISNERRFNGRIDIEIIAWDQPGVVVAEDAGLTPQQAIAQGLPKPEDCDLAVIVLWSRIGAQLPADFELKEDGSPYLSGTEWEYLNALKGFKSKRKPAVWVYRRDGVPDIPANDPDRETKFDQWDKLENFFAAYTSPDGTMADGINHYEAPDDFRQQFEQHLRDRLDKLLESLPTIDALPSDGKPRVTPCWTASPYPGLEAFTPEQAPIFFGRGPEIDQLLQQFSNPQVHFVAVVGVSGSGKSSLVKAGLLPRLRTGIIGNAPWVDLIFKPDERGGNPYLALAFALKSRLELSAETEQEIARAMQADAGVAQKHLTDLLAQHEPATELLLVVDQFEALFTQTTSDDRKDFLTLLEHIVAQPRLRVIATLRADFYARAIEEPILVKLLRQDRGTFPLDPPSISAIQQMIIRPAEAAGVELEDGLAQRLLNDAGAGPDAMALIAFTLNQLYQREQSSRFLSLDTYEDLGGVQCAVQNRAETALQGLLVDSDIALSKLFANLVEVNEQEMATRKRAPQSLLQADEKVIAVALTEAQLIVTGEGEDKQATLEVAHETVFSGWERLHQWIRDQAEAQRARSDLECAATEWEKLDRHNGTLLTDKLLERYLSVDEPRSSTADDYLLACKRSRTVFRISYSVLSLLFIITLGILFYLNKSDYSPSLVAKALFVQMDVWPIKEPEMVRIPAGSFKMGDNTKDGFANERPVHSVRFSNEFEIGKYEVTFDEYDLFAAATGREKPKDSEGWKYDMNRKRGKLPVINVSWNEAVAYAAWFSDRTGLNYRLPSEAEWEYAARATTKTPRYWPEKIEGEKDAACTYANVFDTKNELLLKDTYRMDWEAFNCDDEFPFTSPVGTFTANKWGLHDMLGNAWEWNQDCYIDSYEGSPTDGSSREIIEGCDCSLRVLRGGAWDKAPQYVRSAFRHRNTPDYRYFTIGFRLARTL
jgi:formylglycine-generating enzyme required for sulfatase activity